MSTRGVLFDPSVPWLSDPSRRRNVALWSEKNNRTMAPSITLFPKPNPQPDSPPLPLDPASPGPHFPIQSLGQDLRVKD